MAEHGSKKLHYPERASLPPWAAAGLATITALTLCAQYAVAAEQAYAIDHKNLQSLQVNENDPIRIEHYTQAIESLEHVRSKALEVHLAGLGLDYLLFSQVISAIITGQPVDPTIMLVEKPVSELSKAESALIGELQDSLIQFDQAMEHLGYIPDVSALVNERERDPLLAGRWREFDQLNNRLNNFLIFNQTIDSGNGFASVVYNWSSRTSYVVRHNTISQVRELVQDPSGHSSDAGWERIDSMAFDFDTRPEISQVKNLPGYIIIKLHTDQGYHFVLVDSENKIIDTFITKLSATFITNHDDRTYIQSFDPTGGRTLEQFLGVTEAGFGVARESTFSDQLRTTLYYNPNEPYKIDTISNNYQIESILLVGSDSDQPVLDALDLREIIPQSGSYILTKIPGADRVRVLGLPGAFYETQIVQGESGLEFSDPQETALPDQYRDHRIVSMTPFGSTTILRLIDSNGSTQLLTMNEQGQFGVDAVQDTLDRIFENQREEAVLVGVEITRDAIILAYTHPPKGAQYITITHNGGELSVESIPLVTDSGGDNLVVLSESAEVLGFEIPYYEVGYTPQSTEELNEVICVHAYGHSYGTSYRYPVFSRTMNYAYSQAARSHVFALLPGEANSGISKETVDYNLRIHLFIEYLKKDIAPRTKKIELDGKSAGGRFMMDVYLELLERKEYELLNQITAIFLREPTLGDDAKSMHNLESIRDNSNEQEFLIDYLHPLEKIGDLLYLLSQYLESGPDIQPPSLVFTIATSDSVVDNTTTYDYILRLRQLLHEVGLSDKEVTNAVRVLIYKGDHDQAFGDDLMNTFFINRLMLLHGPDLLDNVFRIHSHIPTTTYEQPDPQHRLALLQSL